MAKKSEVKDIEEAKKVLERIVKKEKLEKYPILENTHNQRLHLDHRKKRGGK